jgi:hypothetical protein
VLSDELRFFIPRASAYPLFSSIKPEQKNPTLSVFQKTRILICPSAPVNGRSLPRCYKSEQGRYIFGGVCVEFTASDEYAHIS